MCWLSMVMSFTASYMLTGWLSMLRNGFLHRDTNIPNVIMLDPPVTMVSFETQVIEQVMMELSLEDDRRGQGEAADDKLVTYGRLQSEPIEIGLPDKCHSFVVDSDMAGWTGGLPHITRYRDQTREHV